ncbi:hypothetical protein Desku_2362 [Desulfofundulus kuznetsovii DSM 6115]|uniref:N-acetyltransferase domain-containing protein n=1 Tax=Desulfofundulus kuznetsovii (strain DSM 6115 / VKM B-1805 / 17) TaxID=760568 RepID=A0AAU8PP84_DESK7|nr:hypothetical protein Desku_2362 [Desulfofundulus kuznetsovii DSM 6115]
MSLGIVRVQNRAQFFSFLGLAELIYGRDSRAALANRRETALLFDPGANPALRHVRPALFLALQNDKPVGRIACAVDEFCREENTGFFGAFEAVRDEQIARALMEEAGKWLGEQKCEKMIGPAMVNTNQQVGVLIDGFSAPPTFVLPYNPPYYRELFESCGCKKLADLLAYQWSTEDTLPEEINRAARRARRYPGTVVQPLNSCLPFNRQVEAVHYILNRSMERNWGYIPLTLPEVLAILTHYQRVADPRLLLLARVDHRPAGICFCIPRLEGPVGKPVFRLALLAVVPEFRQRGIDALLLETCHAALPPGSQIEMSQIHEGNSVVLKMVQRVTPHPPVRRYRVYQRSIS